jgi:hypothetical protein
LCFQAKSTLPFNSVDKLVLHMFPVSELGRANPQRNS